MRLPLSALAYATLQAAACGADPVLAQRQATTTSVFVPPTAVPKPGINSTEFDLSQHFCRLWRHASVYANGKIYVDGGETYVPKNNGTFSNTPDNSWTKGMHNHLLVIDLSKSFNNTDTTPYSRILKGPEVPNSLVEHALWYSPVTRKLYQLGGWWSLSNTDDPGYKDLQSIPEASIWQFDTDTRAWSEATSNFALVNTGGKIQRPGAAAYCDAPAVNMSFLFQGYLETRSDKEYTSYEEWSDFKFVEGMLALDTSSQVKQPTMANISVPLQMGGKDFGPRMNGAMVHVPVGKLGVLVQVGGQITKDPTPYGQRIPGAIGGNHNLPLDFVDIYDIETGFWFRQQTFGLANEIPSGRSDICAVVVPAKDNSSFNIYMVSGVDNYATHVATGDIWVLTLPSFQWILVHERPDGIYGHTCHVVGENLLIIGGMHMTSQGDVGTCSSHMPADVYSLVSQNYTGVFDADGARRLAPVPSKVIQAIGGTSEGGAHITSPKLWSDLYLQYIFNPSIPRPTYTPTYKLANGTVAANNTAPPPDAPTDGGSDKKPAIIGGVVGGIGGALILAAAVFFIWRRRRALAEVQQRPPELPTYGEVKDYDPGMSAVSPSTIPAELSTRTMYTRPRELGSENHEVSEMWVPDESSGHTYAQTPQSRTESKAENGTGKRTPPHPPASSEPMPSQNATSPLDAQGQDAVRLSGNTSPDLTLSHK